LIEETIKGIIAKLLQAASIAHISFSLWL